MGVIDRIKDHVRTEREKRADEEVIIEIRDDAKYKQTLDKLRVLYDEREELINKLRKTELNIDACLVMIQMMRERDEIEKENKHQKNQLRH